MAIPNLTDISSYDDARALPGGNSYYASAAGCSEVVDVALRGQKAMLTIPVDGFTLEYAAAVSSFGETAKSALQAILNTLSGMASDEEVLQAADIWGYCWQCQRKFQEAAATRSKYTGEKLVEAEENLEFWDTISDWTEPITSIPGKVIDIATRAVDTLGWLTTPIVIVLALIGISWISRKAKA